MNKVWIALFSQTGSEINELTKKMGFGPARTYTNNSDVASWSKNILSLGAQYGTQAYQQKHDALMDTIRSFDPNEVVLTLHGYLRIIPRDICEKYEIYNGHPGLITKYPELKGMDPQERITSEMEYIGSVCHRVTAGVDEGPVLTQSYQKVVEQSYENRYTILRETSMSAWSQLMVLITVEDEREYVQSEEEHMEGEVEETGNDRPDHYSQKDGSVECIAVIKQLTREHQNDTFVDYNRFQAFKYLWRLGKKDDVLLELKKTRMFLDFAIEALEEERENNG